MNTNTDTGGLDREETKRGLSMKTVLKSPNLGVKLRSNTFLTSAVALAVAMGSITPAWATIDNTATVTGSSPGNTDDIVETATEQVDVENANPELTTTKNFTLQKASGNTLGGVAQVGDTITYTFTAQNTGNQTLTAVSMADPHDAAASGTFSSIDLAASPLTDAGLFTGDSTDDGADAVWDTLAPGDTVTWEATYVVDQDDITNQMGGDGSIDNIATASATNPGGGTTTDDSGQVSVPVEGANPNLLVTKLATDGGDINVILDTDVPVGTVITYVYTIENTGNVPVSNITVSDEHKGVVGALTPTFASLTNTSGNSDNIDGDDTINVLAPGDVATYTATYTVTQDDIDNLQ